VRGEDEREREGEKERRAEMEKDEKDAGPGEYPGHRLMAKRRVEDRLWAAEADMSQWALELKGRAVSAHATSLSGARLANDWRARGEALQASKVRMWKHDDYSFTLEVPALLAQVKMVPTEELSGRALVKAFQERKNAAAGNRRRASGDKEGLATLRAMNGAFDAWMRKRRPDAFLWSDEQRAGEVGLGPIASTRLSARPATSPRQPVRPATSPRAGQQAVRGQVVGGAGGSGRQAQCCILA
jgi:hypothetical protein